MNIPIKLMPNEHVLNIFEATFLKTSCKMFKTIWLKGVKRHYFKCMRLVWLYIYIYIYIQYIPRNMHTVFALLCFVVVIHWLIFPYPPGFLHWHCSNLTIAPAPAKQPWWIWMNTSCEFIMNDCITTTKQSTTKPCAYFLGYTVYMYIYIIYISSPWSSNVARSIHIEDVNPVCLSMGIT